MASNFDTSHSSEKVLEQLRRNEAYKASIERHVDAVVAMVIMLNSLVLGLSNDIKWDSWQTIDYGFTVFFFLEMVGKILVQGLKGYFFGPDRGWNRFDSILVFIAIVDTIITVFIKSVGVGRSSLTLIKMFRLGRLARLVRLLRFRFFKELKTMIQGVFAGLRVLFWAVVLLFFFIYFLAIVLQRTIGADNRDSNISSSFSKVPWAMFTLFRCFTDSCVAPDGTPLQVHLYNEYGAVFMLGYMLVSLFVTIGLFNLIMAIFVDNVMESKRVEKQEERNIDRTKVEQRLRSVVGRSLLSMDEAELARNASSVPRSTIDSWRQSVKFVKRRWRSVPPTASWREYFVKVAILVKEAASKSESAEEAKKREEAEKLDPERLINRDEFLSLLDEPALDTLLQQMDIETSNRDELFDVLDADMSGELDLNELIVGLMSLRGPAEKKDIVGSLLCARVTQQVIKELQDESVLRLQSMEGLIWDINESLNKCTEGLTICTQSVTEFASRFPAGQRGAAANIPSQ